MTEKEIDNEIELSIAEWAKIFMKRPDVKRIMEGLAEHDKNKREERQ